MSLNDPCIRRLVNRTLAVLPLSTIADRSSTSFYLSLSYINAALLVRADATLRANPVHMERYQIPGFAFMSLNDPCIRRLVNRTLAVLPLSTIADRSSTSFYLSLSYINATLAVRHISGHCRGSKLPFILVFYYESTRYLCNFDKLHHFGSCHCCCA